MVAKLGDGHYVQDAVDAAVAAAVEAVADGVAGVAGAGWDRRGAAEVAEAAVGEATRVAGLDQTNDNAMARAIVIHNAWYAEPEMIAEHGKLGRSEGCFAMSRKSQWEVMRQLAGGRMIYAEKIA